jgi:very-short-patch-repair endonuclease
MKPGARNPVLDATARDLRQRTTPAEQALWDLLRNRRFLGLKFRRQHRIGPFIADFYCHDLKLVVEVDGGVHDTRSQALRDDNRDAALEELGIAVLRIRNEEVLEDPAGVLKRIQAVANVR